MLNYAATVLLLASAAAAQQYYCPTCNPCITCQPPSRDPPVTWAEWGEWGPCQNVGGISGQTRVRSCSALSCDQGLAQEARACTPQYNPPEWSAWAEWGACSVTCGGGIQQRTRVCDTQCGVCSCPGASVEQRTCNSMSCCTWTSWSSWSECSATCGSGGYRSRTRQCSCYTGCSGHTSEQETCAASIACPVPTTPPTCLQCQPQPPPPCTTCYQPCLSCGYYGKKKRSLNAAQLRGPGPVKMSSASGDSNNMLGFIPRRDGAK